MPDQPLALTRLSTALGAQVHGLDLRTPLDATGFQQLHRALMDHHVLFLRGQHMNDMEHTALGRQFGDLSIYPVVRLLGGTEPLETIEDNKESGPKADYWHTDISWLDVPPKIGILRAEVIPEVGGDTMWASLHAAWDALSPTMQKMVEGLTVRHRPSPDYFDKLGSALGPEKAAKVREKLKGEAFHPLVARHPETQRKLLYFSGSFFDSVTELSDAESQHLKAFFAQHIEQPEFAVRWSWQEGDVAIWDERCTLHRALGDHYPRRRVVRRCTVDAEAPPTACEGTASST